MWKRLGWTLFAICMAYPLVLAVVPATRWAVVSRLRVALADDEDSGLPYDTYIGTLPVSDRESELAVLGQVGGREVDIDELYEATRRHWNDPLYLALFVSRACQEAKIPPERVPLYVHPNEVQWLLDRSKTRIKLRPIWERIVRVCDQGALVEPANAFYPAIAAAASKALARDDKALKYAAEAGSRRQFETHAAELTSIFERAAIKAFGYRGCDSLPLADDVAWAPYLAFLGRAVSELGHDPRGIRARTDMLRVADHIYRDARSDQELASLSGIVRVLTGVRTTPGMSPPESRHAYLAGVSGLARLVEPEAPKSPEARMREIIAAGDHANIERMRDYPTAPAWERVYDSTFLDSMPDYASMSLVSFLAALATLGIVSTLTRLPSRYLSPIALPFIAAAALSHTGVFMYRYEPDGLWSAVGFSAVYLGAGLLATQKRWAIYAIAAAAIAPAVALLMLLDGVPPPSRTDVLGYLAIPVGAFPVYVGIYAWRERRRTSSELFVVPQLAAFVLGIGLLTLLAPPTSWPLALSRFIVVVAIVFATASAVQGVPVADAARQMRRYSYWPTALAGLSCGAALTGYLVYDAGQLRQLRSAETSAVAARQWARDHPDGLLPELRALERSLKAK
jgi:hypothetical protein